MAILLLLFLSIGSRIVSSRKMVVKPLSTNPNHAMHGRSKPFIWIKNIKSIFFEIRNRKKYWKSGEQQTRLMSVNLKDIPEKKN